MNDIDLTEAIEAGVWTWPQKTWATVPDVVRRVLTAALPPIERQVLDKAARDIEAVASDRSYDSEDGITEAYLTAARIVRGGTA